MSEIELKAAMLVAPSYGGVTAIATSTTSARTDLSSADHLGAKVDEMNFITLMADGGDIYVAFNASDAGSINEATTTAGSTDRCWLLKDGVPQPFVPRRGEHWVIHKAASGTPTLRGYVSSEPEYQAD